MNTQDFRPNVGLLRRCLFVLVGVLAWPALAWAQTCPQGFFDPRNGGECWECPAGFNRTVFPVTAANACEVAVPATTSAAARQGPAGCDAGDVTDPRNGGECWRCPAGLVRTWSPVNGPEACGQPGGVFDRKRPATFVRRAGCSAGQFQDIGFCWTCPARSVRGVAHIESNQACVVPARTDVRPATLVGRVACGRLDERACAIAGRNSCDRGLVEFDNVCRARGDCGTEGRRRCLAGEPGAWQPLTGCAATLVPVNNVCTRPACGRLDERACAIVGRDSCDPGLVEIGGTCLARGACGGDRQRACTVSEAFPSCRGGRRELDGQCLHERDSTLYRACALSNEQGPIPGNLSDGIVGARYEWEVQGMEREPLGLWGRLNEFPSPLRPGMGVLRGQCRGSNNDLVDTSLDTSTCTSIPFADAKGILKCSVGSRLDSLRWTSRKPKPKCTEFVLTDFRLTSTCGEIADIRQCAGISADTNKLRCSPEVPPAGPYQDSCIGITYSAGMLTAACQSTRGGYSGLNTLNVSACNLPINNHNGQLLCGDIPSSTVPMLVGQTLGQAKNSLAQSRLILGRLVTNGLLGTDETLVVVSHNPAAGISVVEGSPVHLTVGLKPAAAGTSGASSAKVCDGKEPKYLIYCSACKDNICSTQEMLENNGACKPKLFQDEGFVCSEESAESFLRQKYGYQCPSTKGACKF